MFNAQCSMFNVQCSMLMNYKYFPHTSDELQTMLAKAGVDSLEGLYAQIPDAIRFRGDYDIP